MLAGGCEDDNKINECKRLKLLVNDSLNKIQ